MDLFQQVGEGREGKALDRLATILDGCRAGTAAEQDTALQRAMAFARREWGSYAEGVSALARRLGPGAEGDSLWVEAAEPGHIIRETRRRRFEGGDLAPDPQEAALIAAAAGLAEEGRRDDPMGRLDGWLPGDGPLPERLRQVVGETLALPSTVAAARDEFLAWDGRLRKLEAAGIGALPTACAARREVVAGLWRADLPAATLQDFAARLEFWTARDEGDAAGYLALLRDLPLLGSVIGPRRPGDGTKDHVRRLKADNPDWSLARIGKMLGISRQAVHKHLRGFSP